MEMLRYISISDSTFFKKINRMKENKVVQLTWISKSELALLIKNNILDCIFFLSF